MNKCWASKLGNCKGKISGEHLVSKGLFENESVKVQGFSWCKTEPKNIGINSLVSNVLCQKHNELLSPLDLEAINFLKAIKSFDRYYDLLTKNPHLAKNNRKIASINGGLLEKWFAKSLVNLTLVQQQGQILNLDEIVNFIFGGMVLNEFSRLHFAATEGKTLRSSYLIEVLPLFNRQSESDFELTAGLFRFRAFYFLMIMPGTENPAIIDGKLEVANMSQEIQEDWDGIQIFRRMKEISFSGNSFGQKGPSHHLEFIWT